MLQRVSGKIRPLYERGKKVIGNRGVPSALIYATLVSLERRYPQIADTLVKGASYIPGIHREWIFRTGMMYYRRGRYDLAYQYLGQHLRTRKRFGDLVVYLGFYLKAARRCGYSEATFVEEISQSFKAPHERKTLCSIMIRAGFGTEAVQCFRGVLDSAPEVVPHKALFTVVPVADMSEVEGREETILVPASTYTFEDPIVFEDAPPARHQVPLPACSVTSLTDVTLLGHLIALRNGSHIVTEPAAHPKHGLVAGLWQSICGIGENADHALIEYSCGELKNFDEGILLAGRSSENYFHWLVEYVPKLMAIEKLPHLRGLPLIVPAHLPAQLFEALAVFAPGWPLIKCKRHDIHCFRKLHVPSSPMYVLDRFDIPYWVSGAVSVEHIRFVREKMLAVTQWLPHSRRIYLSRRGFSWRRILNERHLEKVFREFGFEVVYPETMTFKEQVELFRSASAVAAAGGAALTNVIFCQPGTKVFTLMSERNKAFPLHANLASAVGAVFYAIVGPTRLKSEAQSDDPLFAAQYAFSPFSVSPAKVRRALEQLL